MKDKLISILGLLLFSSHLIGQASTLIQNVTCIAFIDGNLQTSQNDVLLEEGLIKKIADANSIPEGAHKVIEGSGKYLVSGISEMHAHIPTPQDGDTQYLEEVLFLYLSNGITVIRGMLGDPYHLNLKKLVENGEILGPRIYTSSPSVNGNSVPDKETAIEKVTQYAEDGYDFLKLHPGLKLEVFNQIVETAQNTGIGYAGHVSVDVGVQRAIESGYESIDHLDGYLEGLVTESIDPNQNGFFGYNFTTLADETLIDELVAMTVDHDVWVVPTQSLFTRWFSPEDPATMMQAKEIEYMPSSTRYAWLTNKTNLINSEGYNQSTYDQFLGIRKKLLKSLNDAGAGILLGSDAPQVMNVPGFSIQHEMQAMSDAGFSPTDIIRAGTINPSTFLKGQEVFGNVQEGLSADLILLNNNPLEDIQNMQSIESVFIRGQLLDRAFIDQRLAEIADRHAD